jgi:hypothetical protein
MIVVAAGEEEPYGKEEGREHQAVLFVTCCHLFGSKKLALWAKVDGTIHLIKRIPRGSAAGLIR